VSIVGPAPGDRPVPASPDPPRGQGDAPPGQAASEVPGREEEYPAGQDRSGRPRPDAAGPSEDARRGPLAGGREPSPRWSADGADATSARPAPATPPRPSAVGAGTLPRVVLGVVASAVLAAAIVLGVLAVAPPGAFRGLLAAAPPAAPAPPAAAPLPAADAARPLPAGAPAELLGPFDEAVSRLYEDIGPAVVNITTTAYAYDVFRVAVVPQQGSGSGFLFDEQGHIATNDHVVRDATQLEVSFSDGTRLPGRLVGRDTTTDLAVVQVDLPAGLRPRPIPLADSGTVRVGQFAIAIGNPFGFQRTITTGVISSVGRTLRTQEGRQMRGVLQTDAAINPGNSGGPLLNARGEAVGINTMIFSPSGGSVGVGFATASNAARRWLPELLARGHASHPWVGFDATPLTPALASALRLSTTEGLLITTVPTGSPAAQAGLRGGSRQVRVGNQRLTIGGDIVTAVDGRALADPDALDAYVEDARNVGDAVRVDYVRDGRAATTEIRLGERPG
jgi:S1-C subfamily serine protease